jgi:hypothetical protein
MCIDQRGNIYTSGTTGDITSRRIKFGTDNTSFEIQKGAYVQKMDNAGNLLWAKNIAEYNEKNVMYRSISINKVAVDSKSNIVMIGSFYGTYDFDPGNSVVNLSADEASKTIFICKWSERSMIKK